MDTRFIKKAEKAAIATDISVGADVQAGGASDLSLPAGSGKPASAGTAYDGAPGGTVDIDKANPMLLTSLSFAHFSGNVTGRSVLLFGDRGMMDITGKFGYRSGTNASAVDLLLEPSLRFFVKPTSYGPINIKASVSAGAQKISGQVTSDRQTKDFSGWMGQLGASVGGDFLYNNKYPIGVQIGIQKNFGSSLGNGVNSVSGTSVVVMFDVGALILDSGKLSWKTPDSDAGDPTLCERDAAGLGSTPKTTQDAINTCTAGSPGRTVEPIAKAAGYNVESGNPENQEDYNSRLDALALALGNPKYVAGAHDEALVLMDKFGKGLDKSIAQDGANAYLLLIEEAAPHILPLARVNLDVAKKMEEFYDKAIAAADKLHVQDKVDARIAALSNFYAGGLNRELSADIQTMFRHKADKLIKDSLALLTANPELAADNLTKLAEANTAVKGIGAKNGRPAIAANAGSTLLAPHGTELFAVANLITPNKVRSQVVRALKLSLKAPKAHKH